MNIKRLRGKDGELILTHKGLVFATAERFTAELIEQTKMIQTARLGTYSIGTGYRAVLRLNDVTITDQEYGNSILNDLGRGLMPELGFQGKFRRIDGLTERIVFRNCVLAGELDYTGLLKGFVWDMELAINSVTDEQISLFQTHG